MIAKSDFPRLSELIEAYYFQTWMEVWGDDWDAPLQKSYLPRRDRSDVENVLRDIARFEERAPSDDEVATFITNFEILPTPPEFREFLSQIRELFMQHLSA